MPEVQDLDDHRFVISDGDEEAELVYRHVGNRLVLIHTGVPESWGGRGVGGQLVRAAIDRGARDHLVVVPLCAFARGWLEQHPDEAARVTIDWGAPRG